MTYKYRVSQKSFPLSNKVITQDVFSLETKLLEHMVTKLDENILTLGSQFKMVGEGGGGGGG